MSGPSQNGFTPSLSGSLEVPKSAPSQGIWSLLLIELAWCKPSLLRIVSCFCFLSPNWGLTTSPWNTGSAPRGELTGSSPEIFLGQLNTAITPHFLLRLISYSSIKGNKSPSWKDAQYPLWGRRWDRMPDNAGQSQMEFACEALGRLV